MDQFVSSSVSTRDGGEPTAAADSRPFTISVPRVELPRGGGAIRGLGEKFSANPVTGTGSMTVPIPTSPGRGGFGPELTLMYDSGFGNGPFGFGWFLNLPHVTRRTDRGLPQYDDAAESDVFLISGADDLVPVLAPDASRFEDRTTEPGYVIHRYRPRIEALFARIERWTRLSDGDVHWRSVSTHNVLTIYGKDAGARITDPADPARVFSWLVCETRDDKGNGILYDYKAEDGEGIDLAAAHERNRGPYDAPRRTVNRYVKRIRYGNRVPLLDLHGRRPRLLSRADLERAGWMFEIVFDYGEHALAAPHPTEDAPWTRRIDPHSTWRSGFEVRTSRRCRRVLMFHDFEDEPGVGRDCLVRSTDFTYGDELSPPDPRRPIHSFIRAVIQCGYRRQGQGYVKSALPPLEFDYSVPVVQSTVQDVDAASLENLPSGLDGSAYQWTDLHGEGIPGLLTEQAGAWYYKRNVTPISERPVELAALERVGSQPNFRLADGQAQLMDLAGDGLPDLVILEGPTPGFHEHDEAEGWGAFRAFTAKLNRSTRDVNLRFIDLDGDGRADLLITEDDALVWHASLGEDGFGPARRVAQAMDEEAGPRLVFADPEQAIFQADMNGDGLTDLVRVRNGEICYWPNLGYCRFGPKVSMDHAPYLDRPDQFDQHRIRLVDIDGTGAADLIYLGSEGPTLFFNQSGDAWSEGQRVAGFPAVDDITTVQVADLMGNGTACLLWSSPLPGDATRALRFVDLMGGEKPHLLVRSANNLGAETVVHYAPSTRFYLADKLAGRPWITKIPFPVHVVERIESLDRISGSRFVTRYSYHHGYFDGAEREFRGFAMVEQFDTEQWAASSEDGRLPNATNIEEPSHVPPVVTRTWFHTGIYLGAESVSNFFAGGANDRDSGEYYREPGLEDEEARAWLLDDTILPDGLSVDEERDACRALNGAMLRRETYAVDGTERAAHPYVVTEQNFTVRLEQHRAGNRHCVFFVHAREAVTMQYERSSDPRIAHVLTLEVDDFGNVTRSASVGYGRRRPDRALPAAEQAPQAERHITCTENHFTNAVDTAFAYRTPLPSETRTYELSAITSVSSATRLTFDAVLDAASSSAPLAYEEAFTPNLAQKRLIDHSCTQYRPDDLGASQGDGLALLPPGRLESLALSGESYKLAFTPGLIAQQFGERVSDVMLATEAGYRRWQGDSNWWLSSGRVFFSPGAADDAGVELAYARQHFFQPHRFREPFYRSGFETESVVRYDAHNLAIVETRDVLGNVVAVSHDYRMLQPRRVTDPNGNRSEVAFDALGMVVGTAVMGKAGERVGDSLQGFTADLDEATALAHIVDPFVDPQAILQRATSRIVVDLFAYVRSRGGAQPQPAVLYALTRETHAAELENGAQTRVQHSFQYSDGFGRVIQQKLQAEAGPLAQGGSPTEPRWVGSGWTIFNNKGKPVRQYEPFFSATHRFDFAHIEGVSPVLFYDPVGRVVATLHPNRTWEKVVFDAWRQERWDVNDTVLTNPDDDPDVRDFFRRQPASDYLPTWHAERAGGALGVHEQAAALAAAVHAATPAVAHVDSLGRPYLFVAHNRRQRSDAPPTDPPEESFQTTRLVFDIEGNQREVVDSLARTVLHDDYDMLGNAIHSSGMDTAARWTLNDIAGKAVYGWDSRGHRLRTVYDVLSRPTEVYLQVGALPERLAGRTVYGESQPDAEAANLRGRPYQTFDAAGVVSTGSYDFKGNALISSRELAVDYKTAPDWSDAVALEADVLVTRSRFDALNRLVTRIMPDDSAIRREYNEANLLDSISANLRGRQAGGQPVWTTLVANVAYDASGRRTRIEYGNGAATTCEYDPLTLRLIRWRTVNGSDVLQDLFYTYDPAGNVTHIEDQAQQAIYFRNVRVEAGADYRYDAIYQLIEATGREHVGGAAIAPDAFDRFRTGLDHPGDGQALGRYLERYRYDGAGNLLELQHLGSGAASPGWTRTFRHAETSRLEAAQFSNRLSTTQVGDGPIERYTYDPHGNMTSMPHLPLMQWNHRDQLVASAQQVTEGVSPETTYCVYDAGGQRVRKVTERAGPVPSRVKDRTYLGGFEIYREYIAGGDTPTLERGTLHVIDDQRRLALIEMRMRGEDGSPPQLIRYQCGNHLGSASLELNEAGGVISYEEFYPYGASSYQAVDPAIRAAVKRYRFTGMERDEETGLAYHAARYYAAWLARWTAADPLAGADGVNLYAYSRNNPVRHVDTTGTFTESAERKSVKTRASLLAVTKRWEALVEAQQPDATLADKLEILAGDYNAPSSQQIVQNFSYHGQFGKFTGAGGTQGQAPFPIDFEHFIKNASIAYSPAPSSNYYADVHLAAKRIYGKTSFYAMFGLGNVEEAYQAVTPFARNDAARTSAFSPEDIVSNYFGLLYGYRLHGQDKDVKMADYTERFFSDLDKVFRGESLATDSLITPDDVAFIELWLGMSMPDFAKALPENSRDKATHMARVNTIQDALETDSLIGWYAGGQLKFTYGLKDLFTGNVQQNLSKYAASWREHMAIQGIPTEAFGIPHPLAVVP